MLYIIPPDLSDTFNSILTEYYIGIVEKQFVLAKNAGISFIDTELMRLIDIDIVINLLMKYENEKREAMEKELTKIENEVL